MKTFLDYEADFGGANRVLIAVVAKRRRHVQHVLLQYARGVTRT
jgi:hypothetical protein